MLVRAQSTNQQPSNQATLPGTDKFHLTSRFAPASVLFPSYFFSPFLLIHWARPKAPHRWTGRSPDGARVPCKCRVILHRSLPFFFSFVQGSHSHGNAGQTFFFDGVAQAGCPPLSAQCDMMGVHEHLHIISSWGFHRRLGRRGRGCFATELTTIPPFRSFPRQ